MAQSLAREVNKLAEKQGIPFLFKDDEQVFAFIGNHITTRTSNSTGRYEQWFGKQPASKKALAAKAIAQAALALMTAYYAFSSLGSMGFDTGGQMRTIEEIYVDAPALPMSGLNFNFSPPNSEEIHSMGPTQTLYMKPPEIMRANISGYVLDEKKDD